MELTTKQIVAELDKYIVGQNSAKKALSIAFRNRWRRKQIAGDLKNEILPHNILMTGPTGVGKTEIARRLAIFSESPFVKIEATKFTEIGYVGRDVDSIIEDLLEDSIELVREDFRLKVSVVAMRKTKSRIIDSLIGKRSSKKMKSFFLERLNAKELDDMEIKVNIQEPFDFSEFDLPMMPPMFDPMDDIMDPNFNKKKQKKKTILKISKAIKYILEEEIDKLTDEQIIINKAIKMTEEEGIVFLDEIDKIAGNQSNKGGGGVNREGVQRELLPLMEGTVIETRYGPVRTDHVLFIGSGAFYLNKPSDLLPELQGRMPIRVELSSLSAEDLLRIIRETKYSLPKKYSALLKTEGVDLKFTESGLKSIAEHVAQINNESEDIGARRLHAFFEKVLGDISFHADEMKGAVISVDDIFVKKNLFLISAEKSFNKFIL